MNNYVNYFPNKINILLNCIFFIILYFLKDVNFVPLITFFLELFYINKPLTLYDFPKLLLFYNIPIGLFYFILCSSIDIYYYKIKRRYYKNWKIQKKFEKYKKKIVAIKLSYLNIACISIYLSFLSILHSKTPILKIYTDIKDYSILWYCISLVLYFLNIDFLAYLIHRILHLPFFYKNIHKHHHYFLQPTPFVSLALHPLEYFLMVNNSLLYLIFINTHINVVIINLLYVFIFNILNHSGIYIDLGLIIECSSKYHDDHHKYFHINFGQSLCIWDILFGTIKKEKIKYSEKKFFY